MAALPSLDVDVDWKLAPRLWGHSLHALCSYPGTFPPSLAHSLIGRLSRPGDVVADPFSGRGTLPLEACIEGRVGVGNDLSPLAYLLTSVKVEVPTTLKVTLRLGELRREWLSDDVMGRRRARIDRQLSLLPPEISLAFHPETLSELVWLRERLLQGDPVDAFLLCALAGVLHGPTPGFLSAAMSNVYSRSRPATRAAEMARGRRAPRRDTFAVIERKVGRVLVDAAPSVQGIALRGDARTFGRRSHAALQARGLPPIRLVVTSPPYLGVLSYGHYNWMRLWLIGADSTDVDAALDEPRLGTFAPFMYDVLADLKPAIAPDGVVAIVLGNISRVRGKAIGEQSLAELTWERAAQPAGYSLVGAIQDPIRPERKVSKMWGGRAGAAGTGDTILVMATSEAGSRRAMSSLGKPLLWPERTSIQRRTRSQ